jgi:hypothetical protein
MPRIGLVGPVKGGTTGVSWLNSNTFPPSSRALVPLVAEATPRKVRQTNKANNFFISQLLFLEHDLTGIQELLIAENIQGCGIASIDPCTVGEKSKET